MNTQVSYFKKALVVLMAVIMVFSYMPSMAWADSDDSGTAETSTNCLVFTTDLDDSEVHFCPNSDPTKSYQEIIEVKVTQYYDAEGNRKDLPEGTSVTYNWYRDGKKWRSIPGKAYQSAIVLWNGGQPTSGTYYATASATIDGVEYTGTSKTLSAKLGIPPIQASITVNQKGVLASTKDGEAAFNLPLTVVDLDGDDKFSLDEALKAAHKAYKTEADYEAAQSGAYFTVSKFWGEATSNLLFLINETARSSSVNETYLEANDQIYASINKDDKYYSDVYCKFDITEKTVLPKEAFTLTLTDGSGKALSGVQIGTWENGSFQALEGKKTDENGSVSLAFPTGEYLVTAQGTSKGTVQDWSSGFSVDVSDFDRPLMAPACTIISAMPNGNAGQNGGSNAKWIFDLDTKVLTISGTGETASSTLIGGVQMPWKAYVEEIEKVVVEEGITSLHASFGDCPKLESVSFPKSLELITGNFNGCGALKNIQFDEECKTEISGGNAFANCTALEEVTLPAGTKISGRAVFGGCTSLKKATIAAVEFSKSGVFAGCAALEEVIYQEGVTSFGKSTFRQTSYGGETFHDCISLKKVYVPSTLTEWGETPFPVEIVNKIEFYGSGTANFSFEKDGSIYNKDKTVLYHVEPSTKSITIPASVTTLNPSCFEGFTKLTKVIFEEESKITEIPARCFADCTALKEITLPDTVESIGDEAFSSCNALQKIVLSSALKTINHIAFSGCSSLESIDLPNGIKKIGQLAFQDCEKLKEIKLPESLTDFGTQAIMGTSIEEIVLPPSITKLTEKQFAGCRSLKRIEVQGKVTSIPSQAFMPCSSLETLILPKTVRSATSTSFSDNYIIYYRGTTVQCIQMNPSNIGGIICNYVTPTTEKGKLQVASMPSDIVVNSVEELKTLTLDLKLEYPEGTTAASDDKITVDWYYTTQPPDGLKGLRPLFPNQYDNKIDTKAKLLQQAAAGKPGAWYYVCVAFKITADGQRTMLVTDPISVTVRDSSVSLDGLGTATDPYKIKNYDDLKLIAEKTAGGESFANTYFALKTDDIIIPTDWQQIGTSKTPFEGIFDGEEHTLTYAKGAKCLFNRIGSGTVKNLKVQGEYIASAGIVNVIGPTAYGGKSGTLLNCKLLCGTGTKTRGAGLIGGSEGANITNCEVESGVKIGLDENGDVVGKGVLGSIVGAGAFVLVGCKSGADIYSTGSYVGGLAGIKSYAMRACTIKNSQFTGSIHADGEYIGGILGAGYDDQTAPNTLCAVIENCYVNADITGAQAVGGLFGGEGGCDQCFDNGIGYIRNNVFYGALHLNGKEIPPNSASSGSCAPADNIGGTKGAAIGFMRSLNKYNVIENNYYFITNGEKEKGIGAVEHIDTSKVRPMGLKDGTFYYDTSKDSLKDIADWVDREDGPDREFFGVSATNKNRTDDPLGVDKDNLAKACTQKEMTDGSIVKLLNANANSMHNWVQGENCPVLSDKAVAYKIEVGGDYRKEYYIGDKLDLSGIQFTVTWSDGTTTHPTLKNGVTVTGFDSSKQAIVHLTAAYENATCDFTVKINKRADGTPTNPNTIKVNLTLLGDSLHGENGESHTLKNGGLTEWLPSKDYEVDLNATVWDFLQEVEKKATNPSVKFNAENSQYGMYISSVTYNGTNGTIELGQMDNGPSSGWMYTLNGKHPLLAVSEQFLKDGDKIVFHYTDDYTVEQGSEDWNTPGGGVVEEVKNVTTDAKTGTTTAPTEVKVSEKKNADGTKTKVADVKVSADNQKEILKQAKEKKSNEIILVVPSKEVGDATKADVTLDKSFIDSIVKDTNAKLTIKTPFGDKTYTQDELKAMSEAATGSTVTVAIEKAAEPTDDAAAKIEKAKSIVKDMKLVARSSKTAKKNIKAVLKSDAKVKASIQELKDLGFTVKYRFYRSTKKAASYKSTVTKKTATYTNTSGKKGTKYFYKVQVRVYDENGKLIAKTALKQCKYATRTWSKAK